jgi:integrase
MSVRVKRGRWIIEIYDAALATKRHVTQDEMRALGFAPPRSERQARKVEREVLRERDRRGLLGLEERIGTFATRWPEDYRRGKGGRLRSDSTAEHNRERVRRFGQEHAARTLRSITRTEARAWANDHPSTVPALRAMFSDAVEDKLADDNPFARLGLANGRGRGDIIVLTREEVHDLAGLARRHYGERFGPEVEALILWGAYTCMRPGESFAARYSLLDGDVYDLRRQFNSTVGRETSPKHNSTGLIYVPEPAQHAVLEKPRRISDDLIFRTKRGKQFRQESHWRAWDPIRRAFAAALPTSHHLRERVSVDPDDQLDFYELRHFGASYMLNELELEPWVIAEQLRHNDGGRLVLELYGHPDHDRAIERIRRAYTGATVTPLKGTETTATGQVRGTLRGQP